MSVMIIQKKYNFASITDTYGLMRTCTSVRDFKNFCKTHQSAIPDDLSIRLLVTGTWWYSQISMLLVGMAMGLYNFSFHSFNSRIPSVKNTTLEAVSVFTKNH